MVIQHLQVPTVVRPNSSGVCGFDTTGDMPPLSGNLTLLKQIRKVRSKNKSSYWIIIILAVTSCFPHLVVVIQQSQSCCTILISIDAHHGFSGSSQWVLQVAPPCLILAAEHSARWHKRFVRHHHHQPFTGRTTRQW